MKKIIILFFPFFIFGPLSAQTKWEYNDYTDGRNITIDGITYIIENDLQEIAHQRDRQIISIRRIDEPNEQFDRFGEFPDGTFGDDPDECAGIIIAKQETPLIIRNAWKKAFSKEEREAHPEVFIYAFPILDLQGNIVALAFTVPIYREYVIQPEQIAVLDRELRATLQFGIDRKRAQKFIRVPGRIPIYFKALAKLPDIELSPDAQNFRTAATSSRQSADNKQL